jgi:hypothetical protein
MGLHTNTHDKVYTSQITHCVLITNSNQLILFRKTIVVYCEDHIKRINMLGLKCRGLLMLGQVAHSVTVGHRTVNKTLRKKNGLHVCIG